MLPEPRESDQYQYQYLWGNCADALAGNAWTKEKPKTPCRLMISNVQSTEARIREDGNIPIPKNLLMLVEMIAIKKIVNGLQIILTMMEVGILLLVYIIWKRLNCMVLIIS